jgi:single-stranded-DNA-specific exonuclease
MRKNWKPFTPDIRLQNKLSDELGVSAVFAQVLINRGIKTPAKAQSFLFGDLSHCYDPLLMKDMGAAVERIKEAVRKREKILVYGDYDVDGVTSTALLFSVLKDMGAECSSYIPNRLVDGYGLNIRAVARARDLGVGLIITVDCGTNSFKEIKCANEHGIDVVVTDHHVPDSEKDPPAYAIVNPHQQDCSYPFKYLSGAGVAYKLAEALFGGGSQKAREYLDLVALGTIADVVPLKGENRILAREGLKRLRYETRPGLRALMDIARVKSEKLTCRDIAFALGPRINAMGRTGSADKALGLMLCDNESEGTRLSRIMDRENRNRREIEKNILKEALEKVKSEVDLQNDKVIVLEDSSWHPGVIGIVASRLAERFMRPSLLIAFDGDKGKGSGRSVNGFDLYAAVSGAGEFLSDFGGHKAACGLKIEKDRVGLFRDRINQIADSFYTVEEETLPDILIDMKLPFSNIDTRLIKELKLLMPFGSGNHEPVFATNGMRVKNVPRNIGRSGFKFLATCGNITYEAITFRRHSVERPAAGDIINLAYYPSINSYRGIDSIQLNIKDIQVVS